eukprot:jgi/Mesen1/10908/ME000095S10240
MVKLCSICDKTRAMLKRPKNGQQVHDTIVANQLFKRGDRVAIAASGGKDSTVLAHVMTLLNARHAYGLDLFLLSVDEGISGYRDDSLETVKRNEIQYGIPLEVVSYRQLYGWTMDDIVRAIGRKSNCTFCGVFRRQFLQGSTQAFAVPSSRLLLDSSRQRSTYAYFKKLDYFSTECIYSPNAYRGFARDYVKNLEAMRPRAILDIIQSAEEFRISAGTKMPEQGTCELCGYISSQKWCKACVLLDGLNRGLPRLGVTRTRTPKGSSSTSAEDSSSKPGAGAGAGARKPLVIEYDAPEAAAAPAPSAVTA